MYFIFSLSISDFSNKAIPRTYQSPLVYINNIFLYFTTLYIIKKLIWMIRILNRNITFASEEIINKITQYSYAYVLT